MKSNPPALEEFAPDAFRFYRHALRILEEADVPYLVGGAYAFGSYTGIIRHTKDLDVFVRPGHTRAALDAFAAAGYETELTFSHWLGKAFHNEDFVDVIFNSGNGMCPVDDTWFDRAVPGMVLGTKVRFMPAEEMIWQKAFIMERERFDGADVIHLLRARGPSLDWDLLVARFGRHWRILLSHLILFGFVYPYDRHSVPHNVVQALASRLEESGGPSRNDGVCQGPLLSRTQYLADLEDWGYCDPRRRPTGSMTDEQLRRWTDAGR